MPVVPLDVRVYTELVARRFEDPADVAVPIDGADTVPVRRCLAQHAPDLVPRSDRIAGRVEAEG